MDRRILLLALLVLGASAATQTQALRIQTEGLQAGAATARTARVNTTGVAQSRKPDGDVWRGLSALTQTALASGLLSGAGGLSWRVYATDDNVTPSDAARLMATLSKAFDGISVEMLQDGLTTFYQDFRNRRIEIVDAAYVVIAQIIGRPQQKIDETIQRLRAAPRER